MSKIEELEKRVTHLETEVELLKELVKLQNRYPERVAPTIPISPWYKEPTLEPPYKVTCGGKE